MKTREHIGGFQIERKLAAGGMGAVYLGINPRSGERVAIKTVLAESSGQMLSLRREIRALLSMSHPALVRIVDHGLLDEVPWFAMEYIEGVSLRESFELSYETSAISDELIETMPAHDTLDYDHEPDTSAWVPQELPPEEQRRLMGAIAEICHGLSFMHGHGLVHQDLKPENIIIRRNSGRPALVDFGIASRSASGNREHLTRVGEVAGTPAYMAPEQALNQWTDGRTDLYAIGCILYEIVAGHPPFYRGSAFEILSAHAFHDVPPLDDDVDPRLATLIERLLAKEPEARPGYADLVARALEQILRIEPPGDFPPTPVYVHRPAFVGREEPMQACIERLQDLKEGVGSTTVISGPSGSGKTRFATELMNRIEQDRDIDGMLIEVGTSDGDMVPFQATLSEIADRCRERGPEYTRRVLGEEGAALASLYPRLLRLPGMQSFEIPEPLPATLEVVRRTEAWTRIVLRLSGGKPVAMVLDQLMPKLMSYLVVLRREIVHHKLPIALFITSSAEAGRYKNLAASDIVELGPLSPEELESVIETMLAIDESPEALTRFLVERSRGLPAMVAEYLTFATERGLISRDQEGNWSVRADEDDLEALGLPERLGGLMSERIRSLPEKSRDLLQSIAVYGGAVSIALLARLVDEPRHLESLDVLLKRGLLVARDDKLAFAEGQARTAALELMKSDHRARIHGRVADAMLESLEPTKVVETAEHLGRANRREEALDLLFDQAMKLERAEYEQLYRNFIAYMSLDPPRNQRTLQVYLRLSQIGVMTGRAARVIESAREGIALAEELQDDSTHMVLVTILAFGLGLRGDFEEAIELARSGIERAVARGAEQATAMGYYALGTAEMLRGHYEDAVDHFEAAADGIMTHYGTSRQATILHINLTNCLLRLYRIEEAVEALETAEIMAERTGHPELGAYVLGNRASLLFTFRDDDEAATEQLDRAVEQHRACHDRYGEANALISRASLRTLTGDIAGSRDDARRAIILFGIVDDEVQASRATGIYAFHAAACGDVTLAKTLMPKVWSRAPDHIELRLYLLGMIARMHRRLGELDEAAAWLEKADALQQQSDDPLEYIRVSAERILLAVARGETPTENISFTLDESQLAHRQAREELHAINRALAGDVELFRGEPRDRYAREWPGHSRS